MLLVTGIHYYTQILSQHSQKAGWVYDQYGIHVTTELKKTISKWCNLLTMDQGRICTSTRAFWLHSRAVPLKPLILPIARDRAQGSNYLSHNDRYSNAINLNPFHSAELQLDSRDLMTHSCFWFSTCLVTDLLLGYTKKTTSLPEKKSKWQ